jgi:hypothetical protein
MALFVKALAPKQLVIIGSEGFFGAHADKVCESIVKVDTHSNMP